MTAKQGIRKDHRCERIWLMNVEYSNCQINTSWVLYTWV